MEELDKKMDEISKYKDIFNDEDKKKQYDERAERYDEILDTIGYGDPDVTAKAVAELGLPLETKYMDFGCGTGRVAESLVKAGYKFFDGIDASTEMINKCKSKGIF